MPNATQPALRTLPTAKKSHFRDVGDLATATGHPLFEWQLDILKQACEYEPTNDAGAWRWARGLAIIIVPRRNGKTWLILWRVLAGVLLWDERAITYTAHNTDTALETFRAIATLLVESPLLSPFVDRVYFANGKERIVFTNGAVFAIRTRTKSGGRGLESDCLILDESLELQPEHEDSLLPLLAKAELNGRGQLWVLSSAGHGGSDRLQHYATQGRKSLADDDPTVCYVEYSAPRGVDLDDEAVWTAANPSLGRVISLTFLRRQRLLLSDEAFGREHLGWWTTEVAAPLLPPGSFEPLAGPAPAPLELVGRPCLGLEVQQGIDAKLVVAADLVDGGVWLDVLGHWHDDNGLDLRAVAAAVQRLAKSVKPRSLQAAPFTCGPILDLMRQVNVHKATAADFRDASQILLAAVTSGKLRHSGDPALSDLITAGQATSGDGVAVLSRKNSPGFSTAAVATALALRGLATPERKPGITARTSTDVDTLKTSTDVDTPGSAA